MAGGQATAAGQLGMGNTISNALGAAASSYQNQQNFNDFLNRQQRPGYGYTYADPSAVGPTYYSDR
jgi:hypothetical protein